MTSSPIKGTLPRSADPAELRASVKDVAENIMIVDLVRNDLSRVAVTGSVTVPELLAVRPAPGVWHLVSTVTAAVPLEVPMAALLEAAFPPASVTGTPKLRARELLTGWEFHRRGVYCGTVGLASPIAGCELNVAIRTVEFGADGSAVLGVGGGITADSDPDREWDECLHKAAPIVGAMRSSRQRSRRISASRLGSLTIKLWQVSIGMTVCTPPSAAIDVRCDLCDRARSRNVRIQVRGTSSGSPERSTFSKMMDGDSA